MLGPGGYDSRGYGIMAKWRVEIRNKGRFQAGAYRVNRVANKPSHAEEAAADRKGGLRYGLHEAFLIALVCLHEM